MSLPRVSYGYIISYQIHRTNIGNNSKDIRSALQNWEGDTGPQKKRAQIRASSEKI